MKKIIAFLLITATLTVSATATPGPDIAKPGITASIELNTPATAILEAPQLQIITATGEAVVLENGYIADIATAGTQLAEIHPDPLRSYSKQLNQHIMDELSKQPTGDANAHSLTNIGIHDIISVGKRLSELHFGSLVSIMNKAPTSVAEYRREKYKDHYAGEQSFWNIPAKNFDGSSDLGTPGLISGDNG